GSRNSAGPGRSMCGSVVGGRSAMLSLAMPQRVARTARAGRLEPAQRIIPARRPVERESDELGAAADILPRHRAAKAAAEFGHPAVGRIVAIVPHQPEVTGGDPHGPEIVIGGTPSP